MRNGEKAIVQTLPKCDFCTLEGNNKTLALYNFRTQSGQWANGCTEHYVKYRMYLSLGTGKGQLLIPLETV